jgi:hypothetical protein
MKPASGSSRIPKLVTEFAIYCVLFTTAKGFVNRMDLFAPKGALEVRRLDLIFTRKSFQEYTAPKARNSKAQGASPGNMDDNKIES